LKDTFWQKGSLWESTEGRDNRGKIDHVKGMEGKRGYETIIVGCGIAGASVAYFLAEKGMTDILILEREDQPGYHATGRSAAVLVEFDLVPSVLELKTLGAAFLRRPPDGFSGNPLLKKSGILTMFQESMREIIQQIVPRIEELGASVNLLNPQEAVSMMPVVSSENFDGAVYLPEDGHIDVHELLWGYLRHAKSHGADLRCNVEVKGIDVSKGRCCGVITNAGEFKARWVINSAGAWSGKIGKLAGAIPIELIPFRRTIITFAAPLDLDVSGWPLTADLTNQLYFAPESTGLLASPMDEDAIEPCDARPDDLVVATAIDRMERLTPHLVPKSLRNKWAGLRTFAPDQVFVVGEDPVLKGFFWLAGQGGAGIETSPAVGRIAAELIIDGHTDLMDAQTLAPARFKKG